MNHKIDQDREALEQMVESHVDSLFEDFGQKKTQPGESQVQAALFGAEELEDKAYDTLEVNREPLEEAVPVPGELLAHEDDGEAPPSEEGDAHVVNMEPIPDTGGDLSITDRSDNMNAMGDETSKISLQFEEEVGLTPGANIKVVGVGGGGGNAVDRMIEAGVAGVDFIVANTDAQALRRSKAPLKIQIGSKITKGLGAGAKPEMGRESALEDTNRILEHLEGADMVFVTAGLGGGTGTGAAPIIASLASELGALVVAVVTSPFTFEGPRRKRNAASGLKELKGCVDTVITISNDKLLATVPANTPFTEAFGIADDVLRQAVQGISDLINVPGVINLDFADVKTIMEGMGVALMGSGIAEGENRAVDAAQMAISSPLLEEANINGARGVLLNIVGGPDLTMHEINESATLIHEACDPDAEIIFGAVTDENMMGRVRVTVIATGFHTPSRQLEEDRGEDAKVVEYFPRNNDRNNRNQAQQARREPPIRRRTQDVSRTTDADLDREQRKANDLHEVKAGNFGSRWNKKGEIEKADSKTEKLEPLQPVSASDIETPMEAVQEVLMTPQSYGANNLGFDDENDLDIPTYLRNMRRKN